MWLPAKFRGLWRNTLALRVLVALTILLLVGTTAFADGRVIADALEAGNWAAVVMGDGEN